MRIQYYPWRATPCRATTPLFRPFFQARMRFSICTCLFIPWRATTPLTRPTVGSERKITPLKRPMDILDAFARASELPLCSAHESISNDLFVLILFLLKVAVTISQSHRLRMFSRSDWEEQGIGAIRPYFSKMSHSLDLSWGPYPIACFKIFWVLTKTQSSDYIHFLR